MAKTKARRIPSLIEEPSGAAGSQLIARRRGVATLMPSLTSPPLPSPPPTALPLPADDVKPKPEQTAGKAWGDMKAPVLTTELKRELLVVKMRGSIDPKKFYRSSDHKKGLPKFFQEHLSRSPESPCERPHGVSRAFSDGDGDRRWRAGSDH